jgi:DNA-directed RNA polymerase subunit M/transcription elongation factor TFIIS
MNTSSQRTRHRIRQRILRDSHKVSCLHCGYTENKSKLVFHHVDASTKKDTVSNLVIHSRQTMLDEIAKCIVLCTKCHDILHSR